VSNGGSTSDHEHIVLYAVRIVVIFLLYKVQIKSVTQADHCTVLSIPYKNERQ